MQTITTIGLDIAKSVSDIVIRTVQRPIGSSLVSSNHRILKRHAQRIVVFEPAICG
jgi:hypothetical protein